MSPEQCGGGDEVGPASDIYSLGAVGYFVLSGESLFPGKTPMQTLAAHLYERPRPLADAGVVVAPEVERIILRCLEKAPDQRFPSAAAVEHALRDCERALRRSVP